MRQKSIYLDNHATTPADPRVLDAMLPFFCQQFGNAGSVSHRFGSDAMDAVDASRASIARALGAMEHEIVFTSGATESNDLAIFGVCEGRRRGGRHVITVATEHKAVLGPVEKLVRNGFDATWLPVKSKGHPDAGVLDLDQFRDAIRDETFLVSVMLANNEIGAFQPLREIGAICRERGIVLHTDATQAAGKIPVNVQDLHVDLMSLSAHKIYGPKGIGALFVRCEGAHFALEPQISGGGQESGFRSGTLNVPGIVGFAKAIELCLEEMPRETQRLLRMRNRLCAGLFASVKDCFVNGPSLQDPELRLVGNLNICCPGADGEAVMMFMPDVAVASGSACTSANPEPSHVLRALGLTERESRASLRFGLGRFNQEDDIDVAIGVVAETVERVRRIGRRR